MSGSSRKFRRQADTQRGHGGVGYRAGRRGEPLPPSWSRVEVEQRAQADDAMKAVQALLPDRAIILLTAPKGTSTEDVEAFACAYNLTDRRLVANIFQAMLDWWSPELILAQPDRAMVSALREGVAAVSQIPPGEVVKQLGASTARLLDKITERASADAIVNELLLIATSALGLYDKLHAAQQHHAPGGSADAHDAPAPAPLPPRREWPPGDTKTTLVADLRAAAPTENRDHIIEMALAGNFHDYESAWPNPKSMLVDCLARFGYPELAGKARDGGYGAEGMSVAQNEELRGEVGPEIVDALIPSKRGQA